MKPVLVLGYDIPHRKTQDTLIRLKSSGYQDVIVVIQPFIERKNFVPLIPHRFPPTLDISTAILCKNLGYKTLPFHETIKNQTLLLAGARLIPKEITENNTIINAHTGLLPFYRGLDALKWAINDNQPAGISTHIINEEIDGGKLIDKAVTPVYEWDTFHSFAIRHGELEIRMLVLALEQIEKSLLEHVSTSIKVHKRMPHSLEKELLERFEIFKKTHAVNRP